MLTRTMKSMAAGIVACLSLASSSAVGQTVTGTISVGAPPSLAEALSQIAEAFTAYHSFSGHGTYNVSLTVDTVANIKADIVAGGSSGPYDILLSPDYAVFDLKINTPSLVVGDPFVFGSDSLALYSPSVNISAGLPTQLKDTFVVPVSDPSKDIYGFAAAQVLLTTPGSLVAYARGRIQTRPSVGVALAALENGDYPYGFVAKSQICKKFDGVEYYTEGTYHHIYSSTDPTHPYLPIKLKGIKTAKTRDTAQETVLSAFIDFLKGQGSTLGTELLTQFCYTPSAQ